MDKFKWVKLIQESDLASVTKHVLLNLSMYMDETSECYPTIAKQMQDTSLGKNSIINHIKIAVDKGYLKKSVLGDSGNGKLRNKYTAIFPENNIGLGVRGKPTLPELGVPDKPSKVYEVNLVGVRGKPNKVYEVNPNNNSNNNNNNNKNIYEGLEKLENLTLQDVLARKDRAEVSGVVIHMPIDEMVIEKFKAIYRQYGGKTSNGKPIHDWLEKCWSYILAEENNYRQGKEFKAKLDAEDKKTEAEEKRRKQDNYFKEMGIC